MKISIPSSVTRTVAMQVLKAKKHSPTILFGAGVVGVVATTVTACRSTLKLDEVLIETHSNIGKAKQLVRARREDYTETDYKKDMTKIYVQAAARITKLYGPSIILGGLSIAALTGSHKILSSRNAALSAAYAAVDKGFKEYRQRVVSELGEDKDREFRYGTEEKTVATEDKNGPKKKKIKGPGSGRYSMYSKVFGELNDNWTENLDYRIAFLRLAQNQLNDQLRARGHLFLHEAYDLLGFDRTPESTQVGWLWNKGNGDDYVDFGIWDTKAMERFHAFATGLDDAIVLDFNVDGTIWDKI